MRDCSRVITPAQSWRSWRRVSLGGAAQHRATRGMLGGPAVDELLRCQCCLELFTDPHLLPCGHRFCFDCLDGVQCQTCSAPYYRQDVMRSPMVASALSKYRAFLQPSSQHEEESVEARSSPASQPRRSSAVAFADADSEHAVLRHGPRTHAATHRART